ncbi:MAG: hypothetical protein Q8P53_03035 [Candidatus Shapirobacteria bacterium]|nr:hypothetical protein [Candidatus Shapirobacteria bacterium]
MNREIRGTIIFVLKLIKTKGSFLFWFFVRLFSATLPLISIYLFSRTISLLEKGTDLKQIVSLILIIFLVFLLENFTRNLSLSKLEVINNNIQFDIHNYLIPGLELKNKLSRHQGIQTIRNFSEALRMTLELLRQPGADSLISLIATPIILYFLDLRVFVIEVAYISIYFLVDIYTTQHYIFLKNLSHAKTEAYYARLQDSNDIDLEETQYNRLIVKLSRWAFTEGFFLQTTMTIFYSLILFYLVLSVSMGFKTVSDLVLIMGYVVSTQTFLNSLSTIKDKLTDTKVALYRLAKSESVDCINIDDLIT